MSEADALRLNVAAYRRALDEELLPGSEGKYVVFASAKYVSTFETYAAALVFAYGTFGRDPFFVHKVAPLEKELVDCHFACRP